MHWEYLLNNYEEAVAMILFGIGFSNLLLQKNLIKKIIGLNIMDTATHPPGPFPVQHGAEGPGEKG